MATPLKRPPSPQELAFTLVEILVVVAIIGVLAVLGLGASSSLLDRGADAQDLNNLRTIGTAISRFAADNDNRWPNAQMLIPGTRTSATNPDRSTFMELVNRMITNSPNSGSIYNADLNSVWFSKRFAQTPPGQSFDPKKKFNWGYAWGINTHLWGSTNPTAGGFDGRISRVPNVARLVLVGEKNDDGGNDFTPDSTPVFARDVETRYRISRPGNRAYYLFGDYHIESIEGDQSTRKNPSFRTYNPTNRLYYRWW